MAENPVEGLGQKLKKNKLLIPAAIVGGGVGLFFLLRSGGLSGGGGGGDYQQSPYGPPPADEGGDSGGTGDSADMTEQLNNLAEQFTTALGSVTEQFSSTAADLQGQITAQGEASTLTSQQLQDQLSSVVSGVNDALGQMAGSYASPSYAMPDYGVPDYGAPLGGSYYDTAPLSESLAPQSTVEYTPPPTSSPFESHTASGTAAQAKAVSKAELLQPTQVGLRDAGAKTEQIAASSGGFTPTTKTGQAASPPVITSTKVPNQGINRVISAGAPGAPIGVSPINPAAVALYKSGLVAPPVQAVAGSTKPTSFRPPSKPPEKPTPKVPVAPPKAPALPQRTASGKARTK